MGRKSDMSDDSFFLQLQNIVIDTVVLICLPVAEFILAVNEAVIDIVCPQFLQHLLHGFLYGIQIQ